MDVEVGAVVSERQFNMVTPPQLPIYVISNSMTKYFKQFDMFATPHLGYDSTG
jgi:hypothetical protein